jgi:hypothetical protein
MVSLTVVQPEEKLRKKWTTAQEWNAKSRHLVGFMSSGLMVGDKTATTRPKDCTLRCHQLSQAASLLTIECRMEDFMTRQYAPSYSTADGGANGSAKSS